MIRRVVGGLDAVAIGAGALAGCSLPPRPEFSDDAQLTQQITAVRVNGDSGHVEVRGQDGLTAATVHRSVQYPAGSAPPGPTTSVEAGVLVLADCGDDCSVDYTVVVPSGTPVTGKTSSGGMKLTGLGALDVEASSGRIEMGDITGAVRAGTTNGAITGSGLRGGPIQVKTSNGEVDLAAAVPADVRAETTNGGVTLAVPAGRYKIVTDTHNGDRDITVPADPAGDHTLTITTHNGEIRVKPAG